MNQRPNSNAARDIASVLHPYTDLKQHLETGPLVIVRGEGVRVWDDHGNAYIEAMAGLWSAALGFSSERLVAAATQQLRKLPFYHAFNAKSHEPLIQLAEMLLERAPVPMSKAFFANSGSEANDTAIKLVWYYNNARGKPAKKKIISRQRAYHGVTVASASLTGLAANHRAFDLPLPGFLHTLTPHFYHKGRPGESEEQFAARCAEELERLILAEGPETIAAMFAEPVMGAGGVIVPPATYFEKIQEVLRRHDVLLVADEVICGFGRTANYWGSQTFNIRPDILTCAKALSASFLPISAVLVSEEIFTTIAEASHEIGTFGHGFTYSGHPVPAAVAIEALRIYDEIGLIDHVRAVAPLFQKRLAELGEHPLIGEARGVGLIGGLEIVQDKSARRNYDPALKIGPRAAKLLEKHGVIGRALAGDVLAFTPPLIISESEIHELFDRVGEALDALYGQLIREGLAPAP